jgi:hypothetical protein
VSDLIDSNVQLTEQEKVLNTAHDVTMQILAVLKAEQVKLEQAEVFSTLMKAAARDAANSKATLLSQMTDRSENMKNVLRRVRERAMKGPICHECSRKRATRRCTGCVLPYCSNCFNQIHSKEGLLFSHSFLPIGIGSGLVGAGTISQSGKENQKKKIKES